tara:strand:- start:2374 stop:2811 length:438 start_codon:yes stop_codon:yes gene_type:complete
MGRKKVNRKVSDLEISRWMIKFDGKVSKVAEQLDVTTATIYRRMKNSPKIQARLEDADERQVDKALGVLDAHLESQSLNAAKYVLDNRGKKKGFGANAREEVEEDDKSSGISLSQLDTSKMDVNSKKLLMQSLLLAQKKLEEDEE